MFSRLRDGVLVFDADTANVLLAVVDALRRMLTALEVSGEEGEADFSELIQALEALQEVKARPLADVEANGEDDDAPVAVAPPPPPPPAPTRGPAAPRPPAAAAPPPPIVVSPPSVMFAPGELPTLEAPSRAPPSSPTAPSAWTCCCSTSS